MTLRVLIAPCGCLCAADTTDDVPGFGRTVAEFDADLAAGYIEVTMPRAEFVARVRDCPHRPQWTAPAETVGAYSRHCGGRTASCAALRCACVSVDPRPEIGPQNAVQRVLPPCDFPCCCDHDHCRAHGDRHDPIQTTYDNHQERHMNDEDWTLADTVAAKLATLDRVRELADEWRTLARDGYTADDGQGDYGQGRDDRLAFCEEELRAALDGPGHD